jgi:tetratricopeptide (TPR) repeat protein|tara:strand:+ start:22457 stop:23692 length:1236 start_codon:yes stop_codon:yes gene_type:complete
MFFITMCVPPSSGPEDNTALEQAKLDSLRRLKCPRFMSSAAEYYRNRNWRETVEMYSQITELGCDEYDPVLAPPEEIYQYYAIGHEYLGEFSESEKVILKGLQKLPKNVSLRKRLAYSYKKQNKLDMYINEMERLMDLTENDTGLMTELSDAYEDLERYDDQIYILKKLLKKDPNNEIAQGDLALALEKSGEDPLEYIKERFENNPDNVSYGLDYADRLIKNNRNVEAINIYKKVIRADGSNKIAYRKIGEVYFEIDDLESSSKAYEELYMLDPRDIKTAIKISDIYIELNQYNEAIKWAKKADKVSRSSGEAISQIGKVYYKGFQSCRSEIISLDDRIVASLAYEEFDKAEKKGFRRNSGSMQWLKENEVLFGKANWFMLDPQSKSIGFIKPSSSCYNWVYDKLMKQPGW